MRSVGAMWTIWKRRAIHGSVKIVNQSLNAASEIKLDDAKLELLGNYFTDTHVQATTGIHFEQFLNLYVRGRWHERVV